MPDTLPNPAAIDTPEDLRQLDGLIAVAFDGFWTRTPAPGVIEFCHRDERDRLVAGSLENMVPRYTTDDGQAIALLTRVYPNVGWMIGRNPAPADPTPYGVQLVSMGMTLAAIEHADLPLAVIAAMIMALPDGTMDEARQQVALWFATQGGEG